jgi:hypothetical protein
MQGALVFSQAGRQWIGRSSCRSEFLQCESRRVLFEQSQRSIQYASSPSATIERGCSIGANHAQNCRLTSFDPTTRVAIARFGIIRARFNKRAAQAFPRADIRNLPLPNSEVCFVCREATALPNGEASMKTPSLWMIAAACLVAPASVAHARSAYDGSWDLVFVTQKGACDPTYNFTVNVSDGVVTHPNLVKFKGYVAKSGSVRASVTVHEKFASGTGRFSGASGRGRWSGHTGSARCSGYWTAQRN